MKEIELKYKESRRRARLNWARSEHGKEVTKNYMKEYRSKPEVKAKYHEYYIKNKAHWGEIVKARKRKENNWGGRRVENRQILKNHYEWCKANGYDISWYKNEQLHADNAERFTHYEK